LGVGYLYIVVDVFRKSGSRAERPLLIGLVLSLALGELAVALGLVDTRVGPSVVHGVALLVAFGLVAGVEFFGSVVRARERGDVALRASEERFGALVRHSSDVIVVLGHDTLVAYASPAAESLWGRTPDQLVGSSASDLVHPDDRHLAAELFARVLRSPGVALRGEVRVLRDGEQAVPTEFTATNLLADAAVAGIVANVRDISERKAAQQFIDQAARDAVTGLVNRAFFQERLRAATARAGVADDKAAVLVVDLDRFGDVDIRIGRTLADRLLGEVADRLRGSMRPEDCVARLGDDEFAVLVVGVVGPDDVVAVAARVAGALREPFVLGGVELSLTASVGIALCQPRVDDEQVLRRAQLGLRAVKQKGGDGYELFDPGLEAPARRRFDLQSRLAHACERHELVVHYQPIVDLKGGSIAGFEALVRWNHPDRGIVPPAEFIGLAEQTGVINVIGSWVLDEACRQAASWQEDFGALDMHVNLSARQLLDPALLDVIASALGPSSLDPTSLVLEITETVLMDDLAASVRAIERVRALGVRFAIDDFGAGYSSFAYLTSLPTETIKLDRCLVDGLGPSADAAAVVETVVALAHRLGMRALAEGVERPEQLRALRHAQCDLFQGFSFARPMPADEAAALLRFRANEPNRADTDAADRSDDGGSEWAVGPSR
jgi:diguanylate cyclase (GGDEF)-like protein/PAS domain S-box-containing protein